MVKCGDDDPGARNILRRPVRPRRKIGSNRQSQIRIVRAQRPGRTKTVHPPPPTPPNSAKNQTHPGNLMIGSFAPRAIWRAIT